MTISKEHKEIVDNKPYPIGADPHGAMCTGTGHTREVVKHKPGGIFSLIQGIVTDS